jgi:hypothetical protein
VRHTVCVPVCTVEDFRASMMQVVLDETNWSRYEPLVRKRDGGHYAHHEDKWDMSHRTIHLWASPHGLLVMLNYSWRLDGGGTILTMNKVKFPKEGINVSYFMMDGWVWESRSEWLDSTEVVEAVGSKLWSNDPDDPQLETT